jgi:hypothetical protein
MDDQPIRTPSPLEGVSINRFQGKTYTQELLTPISTVRVEVLPNNPNRFFWIAINEGAQDVRVSTDPTISATSGWLIPANGGVISMYWEEDGEGVGYAVYAIAPALGAMLRIREVIRS